jgi:DNA-binding NarL/FixJ family response regulator
VANGFRGTLVESAAIVSGLNEAELRQAWEPYRLGRRDVDPMLTAMSGAPVRVVTTKRRQELVPDKDWYRSRLVSEYFRPLGMNHCIQSEVRLPGGAIHRIAVARAWGDPPLGTIEQERIHEFHCALVRSARHARPLVLPARTLKVLDQLLAGRSAKQIADDLHLALSTVDRGVRAIYRRYHVHSRAELLSVARRTRVMQATRRAIRELSPRLRQTLALLLTGLRERDIACVVGVSFHTLHQYVKTVYQALGVRSRPELMALLGHAVALDEDPPSAA